MLASDHQAKSAVCHDQWLPLICEHVDFRIRLCIEEGHKSIELRPRSPGMLITGYFKRVKGHPTSRDCRSSSSQSSFPELFPDRVKTSQSWLQLVERNVFITCQ